MANLGDISKINLPNGNVVNIKDATVRSQANWNTNNGVKNLLDLSRYKELNPSIVSGDNLVFHGVTWTISNSSGLTASGTADSSGSYPSIYSATLPIGTYYLTGGDSTIELLTPDNRRERGQGLTIEITASTAQPYAIRGYVPPNTAITGTHNIKPMLRQVGDSTYEPYALPNTKITPELIELVDSGAKNKFKINPLEYQNALNGLTLTWDENAGSVTVTGTMTDTTKNAVVYLQRNINGADLSGMILYGGLDNNNRIILQNQASPYNNIAVSTGTGVEIPANTITVMLYCFIPATSTAVNLTFKPMICSKAAWDVSQKYVPYAISNAELTAKTPVTKSKRHIPQSADYEIVSDLTISIPAGKKYLIHAMAMFSNVAPKGVIINKTNTIAANKNTVYAEITNDANDFGGLTTSAIMSNTGSTAFDVCIFAKFKSANTSGSDVIVTYQDIT